MYQYNLFIQKTLYKKKHNNGVAILCKYTEKSLSNKFTENGELLHSTTMPLAWFEVYIYKIRNISDLL